MRILVTGAAGFIGYHLSMALAKAGYEVVGIDNINDYYDVNLKLGRLRSAGFDIVSANHADVACSSLYPHYRFIRMDICDREAIEKLFATEHFDDVCNLAGQAGVRYSIVNPYSYIESNVFGFVNLLEACRHHGVKHFVYASSSSIYGMNQKVPFSEADRTDTPVSLYAATKKSDEVMAYAYSKLFGFATTAVRFFTVYGPWGRPDMAPFMFMTSILEGKPIKVFNNGHMRRDFTYIDDIISGLMSIIPSECHDDVPARIYNIGCSSPVDLMDFISEIEKCTGRKAVMEFVGMQPGDVTCTYADISRLKHDFGFQPVVNLHEGIRRFYDWMQHQKTKRNP